MALSPPYQMPSTQGGGLRWYSDLTQQWYTDYQTAFAEDSRAKALKDQTQTAQANQATNTASQTAAETTHLATSDELARQRLAQDQAQFQQDFGLRSTHTAAQDAVAAQTAGYQDPKALAQLQADAEARRLGNLSTVMASMGLSGGVGGAGGGGTPIQYGGADATAARDAVYARAKDTIANQQRASLTALHSVAADRGQNVAGGSNPALTQMEGNLINEGQGQLGEVARTQAVQDLAAQQHANDINYTGQIQQRGQNLSVVPSLMGLVTAKALY